MHPVPTETTRLGSCISSALFVLYNAKLYSSISVNVSNVGLFEINPPSKKRPNILKYFKLSIIKTIPYKNVIGIITI